MRYCESCLFNNDLFRNMRVCIIKCSFEGDRNNLVNLIVDRDHYCGVCNIRLYWFKLSDDPTGDTEYHAETIFID